MEWKWSTGVARLHTGYAEWAYQLDIFATNSIKASKTRLKEIESELVDLDEKLAPGILEKFGMVPVTVGIILARIPNKDGSAPKPPSQP